MENKIIIHNKEFLILGTLENINISDSFVLNNKLDSSNGHGEKRLYIGSIKNNQKYNDFFNNFQNIKGIFYKEHLINYLENAKFEYREQSQIYRRDISESWLINMKKVDKLEESISFNIILANGIKDKSRFFIKSEDSIYQLFREISLPTITKLYILKLQDIKSNEILFLFTPFIEYFTDTSNILEKISCKEVERINQDDNIEERIKSTIIQARLGQGKYRKDIIKEFFSECIITHVDDEALLIASHIKPWIRSDNFEKIDKYNGLLLTPTYDKLFDKGFITLENNGEILVSPYLSDYNKKRLDIPDKCDLSYNEKRSKYLEYHRKNIFKK